MCNKHDINGTLHLYFFQKEVIQGQNAQLGWSSLKVYDMCESTVYLHTRSTSRLHDDAQSWNSSHIVSCEVLSVERIKRKVFWNVTPSSSVDRHCFHSYSQRRREQLSLEHLCPSSWLHDIIFQQTSSSWKRSPLYQIQHTWDWAYTTYGNAIDAMPSLIS